MTTHTPITTSPRVPMASVGAFAFAARLLLGAGLAMVAYLLLIALGIVEMSAVHSALG